MLNRFYRLAACGAFAFSLAGCVAPQSALPYPVTDSGPNPAPLPGYRVNCRSAPVPIFGIFGAYGSGCTQELAPTPRPVIRARG